MNKKIAAFVCAVFMICGSVMSAAAADEPKVSVEMAKTGKSAVITVSDISTQVYGIQLSLTFKNEPSGFKFSSSDSSVYATLKEEDGTVTIYADAKQPLASNGTAKLGTLSADKEFSVSSKADLILVDRSLEGTEYSRVSVSVSTKSSSGSSGSSGGSGSYSGTGTDKTVVVPSDNDKTNTSAKFTDIQSHWGKDAITFVADKGLFQGMSDTEFMPNEKMTRAMFVTVLQRFGTAVDKKWLLESTGSTAFNDVSEDEWYSAAVAWASGAGVVSGMGDGGFAPSMSVTREQMAVMIVRFADLCGVNLPATTEAYDFSDASTIQAWAVESVIRAQQAGIIQGRPEGNFDPQATATRAEVATIMQRLVNAVK